MAVAPRYWFAISSPNPIPIFFICRQNILLNLILSYLYSQLQVNGYGCQIL